MMKWLHKLLSCKTHTFYWVQGNGKIVGRQCRVCLRYEKMEDIKPEERPQ